MKSQPAPPHLLLSSPLLPNQLLSLLSSLSPFLLFTMLGIRPRASRQALGATLVTFKFSILNLLKSQSGITESEPT